MKRITGPLLERVALQLNPHVDRENFVVRGVKVLGYTSRNRRPGSPNGRRYEKAGVQAALPLYERVQLKTDHPASEAEARKNRSVMETFGWLENCRVKDDGLYADAHLLKSHDFSARFLEAAERNPSLFVLSHNADGEGYVDRGTHVIESIPEVRSVDVVECGRGGTNKTMLEGYFPMPNVTLRDVIRAGLPKTRFVRRLLEMDDEMMDMPVDDMPMDAPPEGDGTVDDVGDVNGDGVVDATDEWMQKLSDAINSLIMSKDPNMKGKAEKILAIIYDDAAEDEGFNDGEPDGDEEPEAAMESVRELIRFGRIGVVPQPILEGAIALPKKKRMAFLESYRESLSQRRDYPTSAGRPRPRPTSETTKQNDDSPEQLANRMRGV